MTFALLEYRVEKAIEGLRLAGPLPLRLRLWNGRCVEFSSNPAVTISVPRPEALRFLLSPDLNKLGEAFVEGHIRVEGSANEIFRVAQRLAQTAGRAAHHGWRLFAHRPVRHSRSSDKQAVQHHYDVSNDFYALFLDRSMVYSCAYYREENDSLEQAQLQKLDHILTKLRVQPGERLLDIGCGWGALILRAARQYGAIATGITLSRNQYDYAQDCIRAEGLHDRCRVELCDYRDLPGKGVYDKIASVGMFEHVGLKNLPLYFGRIHELLADRGLVLNHGITTENVDNAWMGLGAGEFIDRYVFPDGELPHISLVMARLAGSGLEVVDVESLRRHYARTCEEWSARLEAHRAQAEAAVGEKRMRIWQIYLAGCAFGFANGWMNLYQVLAGKPGAISSAPLTREYMYRSSATV